MKTNLIFTPLAWIGLVIAALVAGGCEREFDEPPPRVVPVGNVLNIEELKSLYQGQRVRFDTAYSVYAVVVADEQSGNLFRNIHVQDNTGAIVLRLNTPGGLYEGDSVRIFLPGTVLNSFQNMMQLDSVDVDINIVKQATQVHVEPKSVTIAEVTSELQGQLIRVEGVEFTESDLGRTFANAETQQTENRTITDCDGNTLLVRTSGFANFAGATVPEGNGSIVAVLGQFNNDLQLFIRRLPEVVMEDPRCTGGGSGGGECEYDVNPVAQVAQNFDDVTNDNTDYANPNWQNINVEGSRRWRGRIFQNDKYLRATGFIGQGAEVPPTEMWLITPPVIASQAPTLTFRSAQAFWSHDEDVPFQVLISHDYDGCDTEEATWTEITNLNRPTQSNSNYQWVPSGNVPLTQYLPQGYQGTYHIAFKYYSVGTQTTTIDIDDINIQ